MDRERFVELLNEHHQWPCVYTFKFVIPAEGADELDGILTGEGAETSRRASRGGKYISITARLEVDGPDPIVAIYENVSELPGLLSF